MNNPARSGGVALEVLGKLARCNGRVNRRGAGFSITTLGYCGHRTISFPTHTGSVLATPTLRCADLSGCNLRGESDATRELPGVSGQDAVEFDAVCPLRCTPADVR